MSTAAKKQTNPVWTANLSGGVTCTVYTKETERGKKKTIKVRGSLVTVIRKLLPYGQIMK